MNKLTSLAVAVLATTSMLSVVSAVEITPNFGGYVRFKYAINSKDVDDKLSETITQIKDRDYDQSFDCNKTRLKMAVVYDANEKKLVAFKEC